MLTGPKVIPIRGGAPVSGLLPDKCGSASRVFVDGSGRSTYQYPGIVRPSPRGQGLIGYQDKRSPESVVREIAAQFPTTQPRWYETDVSNPTSDVMVQRIAFDVELVLRRLPPNPTVIDVGGGLGIFSAAMAAVGSRSVLVLLPYVQQRLDDDHVDQTTPLGVAAGIWERYGVELDYRNVLTDGFSDIDDVDAITAFHVIEHFHNSPKRFLHEAVSRLKVGGVLVIAVPNAANLRKRITVPLKGSGPTPFDDWYQDPVFVGHVREPVTADLEAIAADLGLREEILGRNFLGLGSRLPARRLGAKVSDRLLQRWPSLCSDLYLVGTKYKASRI
jgi:2-polyprenyl-3-methyl-5-hydroxy-6-metoxy-1,4-benzoquinol methylase